MELGGNTAKSRLTFKGDLDTYRFCDDVWTFIVKNVLIKMSDVSAVGRDGNGTGTVDSEVTVDKFKIVACNLRKAADM